METFRNKKTILAVVIIGYNSLRFLKTCLDSVASQTIFKKGLLDVIFIDNLSHDDSSAFVIKNYPWVRVFQNHFNFGYAGAANQGIDISGAPFVSILNPDVILNPDYYEKIVKTLASNERASSATGKLLKYDFENNKKTKIIDTTGLLFHASTRVTDRGQGQKDEKQYDDYKNIWGVSGACPVYKRTTLIEVMENGETFDAKFFMYKEDVDLAWRLNRKGWQAVYVPSAIAYHGRGTGITEEQGIFGLLKSRKSLSRFQKIYSFRNHQLMLKKNLTIRDFIRHPFAITSYEIASTLNAIREGVFFKSFKI
jgi:GT2 family glycosyltransferase